ncbi:MAG: 30S ribosome-binding factor RbfA [Endomicrobia bacterium]|nr:30S ribosome-binding factor RbfA [Endomicrobiia bacterium]MCL2506696.1 30S ribosome-binding factor RbfA [Endomicrobiia bacterium]
MPTSYKRSTRVGELIQQTVSEIIRDIRDLNVAIVTIMSVKLTDDLQTCRIFYSVFGNEEDKKQAAEILAKNTKEVRHQLALKLNLRRTPTITFTYDDTNETASKVFDLLKKIEEEK